MIRVRALVLLVFLAFACSVSAKTGYRPGEQDWGYVEVRKDAHMFYWLYKTTADVVNYTERPLVIWLEGGPGDSSTGLGNFGEIGPVDINGNYRDSTWVKDMNVLFIDNPIGAGFSYVKKLGLLSSNNKQIALDLVEFMKGFYAKHPEFKHIPLHIFGEGYGGKMASEFAVELNNAVESKQIESNLTSVILRDPWISPIDSILNLSPLLEIMAIVDPSGYTKIITAVNKTLDSIRTENWTQAAVHTLLTRSAIYRKAKGVNIYNIEKPITYIENIVYRSFAQLNIGRKMNRKLETLMRVHVSKALGIPSNVKWDSAFVYVLAHLLDDLMKPVIHIVSELLDKTTVKVAVLSGQLDLMCTAVGTLNWIDKMVWKDRANYIKAPLVPIHVNGILEGYKKSAGNFTIFWAGCAKDTWPTENLATMSYILNEITGYGLRTPVKRIKVEVAFIN